jgi:alpha-mannosidase
VISWLAAEAGGSGLAVLLDGPQGADGTPERLGVSLLRAPTWPDPGADHGPQRLRLALMPCQGGWRQAGVSGQAVRFREPHWLRPLAYGPDQDEPEGFRAPAGGDPQPGPSLGLGDPHLRLIGLRCLPGDDPSPTSAVAPAQAAGPPGEPGQSRSHIRLGPTRLGPTRLTPIGRRSANGTLASWR